MPADAATCALDGMGVADAVSAGRAELVEDSGQLSAPTAVECLEEAPMPASNEYQPVVGQPGQSPPSTRAATYSSTTITAQAAVSVGAVVVAAPEEGVGVRDSVQAGLELIGEFAGGQPAKFNPKEFRVELVGETRVSTGHIGPRTV